MMLMDPTATHQRLLLTAALRTDGPMLEMGAGWYSTPILQAVAAARGRHLLTLDTAPNWLARFTPSVSRSSNTELQLVKDWADDLPHPPEPHARWSLVFVDQAPPLARGDVLRRLRERADVFVLHDTEAPGAYGYDKIAPFQYSVTDKTHWTWTTVASDSVDVTTWGLEEFPQEEQPRSVVQYLMRIFPGPGHYFVEAGAHNAGMATLELEKNGWTGLCVEPSTHYIELVENRGCQKDARPLGPKDGVRVTFRQLHGDAVQFSGIVDYFPADRNQWRRDMRPWTEFHKPTVRLSTMLAEHEAPARPEFLCLNTEGSELAILRGHDFDRYRFQVILVDYCGSDNRRQELTDLLEGKGYVRSRGRGWDDGTNLTFIDRGVAG